MASLTKKESIQEKKNGPDVEKEKIEANDVFHACCESLGLDPKEDEGVVTSKNAGEILDCLINSNSGEFDCKGSSPYDHSWQKDPNK